MEVAEQLEAVRYARNHLRRIRFPRARNCPEREVNRRMISVLDELIEELTPPPVVIRF